MIHHLPPIKLANRILYKRYSQSLLIKVQARAMFQESAFARSAKSLNTSRSLSKENNDAYIKILLYPYS